MRRNDAGFLDALGARTIPDPTTAGDFCRRFDFGQIHALMDILNDVRVGIWKQQPAKFFEGPARIDADGSICETHGECKQGMDVAYNGVWGYQPLMVTLQNTGEVLYIMNRGANRPSHEGAPAYFDRAIALCRRAGCLCSAVPRGPSRFVFLLGSDALDVQVRAGLGLGCGLPGPLHARETSRSPRFLWRLRARAVLYDPGRASAAMILGRSGTARRSIDAAGPRRFSLTGLNHTAAALAVYASQRTVARHHARLASGWRSPLPGGTNNHR